MKELANREREAVALVTQSPSNDEICDAPGDQPPDREDPINRAMAKLHACDRAQLVVAAYEAGLVTPPTS